MNSQDTTQRTQVTTTISGRLMNHVGYLLDLALEGSLSGMYIRRGINVYSQHGVPAFILAVAAVEAFVNESFLIDRNWQILQDTPLGTANREQVEWWEIRKKLYQLPQLAFGRTFNKGAKLFQDMNTLVDLRNDLTHYKMSYIAPKYVERLARRRIALSEPDPDPSVAYIWVDEISCSEGIRWAYNTAFSVMQALYDFCPSPLREETMMLNPGEHSSLISERDIREAYKEHGIDPDS